MSQACVIPVHSCFVYCHLSFLFVKVLQNINFFCCKTIKVGANIDTDALVLWLCVKSKLHVDILFTFQDPLTLWPSTWKCSINIQPGNIFTSFLPFSSFTNFNKFFRFVTGTDFVSSLGTPESYPGLKEKPNGCMKDKANHARQQTDTSTFNMFLNDEAFQKIVLGGNYFRINRLTNAFNPPPVCGDSVSKKSSYFH